MKTGAAFPLLTMAKVEDEDEDLKDTQVSCPMAWTPARNDRERKTRDLRIRILGEPEIKAAPPLLLTGAHLY